MFPIGPVNNEPENSKNNSSNTINCEQRTHGLYQAFHKQSIDNDSDAPTTQYKS